VVRRSASSIDEETDSVAAALARAVMSICDRI
jgi:hypothetical protein